MNHLYWRFAQLFVLKTKRRSFQNTLTVCLLFLTGLISFDGFAQTTTLTNPSSPWTVPTSATSGIKTIQVEAWGGGGAGGGRTTTGRAGGGAGGNYVIGTTTVIPGNSYSLVVAATQAGGTGNGTNGNPSMFGGTTVAAASVVADGGVGGASAGTAVTAVTGSSKGGAVTLGGDGGASGTTSGAGGAGANGGAGGGTRNSNNSGLPGTAPGGGGGGGYRSSNGNASGGAGAAGQITITYTLPNITNFSVALANNPACAGNTVSFTLTSSTITAGTYSVSYSISGTSNSVAATTDTVTFASGTATLTTLASLSTAETDQLKITQVTDLSTANLGNYSTITSNTSFTVSSCRAWYSYKTGNFNDYKSWTLDPSGTSFYNGQSKVPGTNDDVTILNGKTITYNISNLTLNSATIQSGATLDMAATTGHNLGTVTGQGTLRVKGSNSTSTAMALPTGTYTDFVATTGGTVEYYDLNGMLPTGQTTYNNLKFTNSGASSSAVTFVEASDLTVNGTLTVGLSTGSSTATWQINDNTNTLRTVTLNGDLVVNTGGKITAGTGNRSSSSQHTLYAYGNITNSGTIQFFDPTQAPFTSDPWTSAVWNYNVTAGSNSTASLVGNAVNVTFSGTNNTTVTCNSKTDFYRFIVDKGTGQQAMVTVNSSSTSNFRFFGPSNLDANTSSGNTALYTSQNALSIINGTLQLTGSINIPVLEVNSNSSGNGYTPIPINGALWLNGANVTVQLSDNSTGTTKDGRILISGLLRVTAGTINNGFGKGLGSQDGGTYWQEGGTVNCWQFRPKATGTGVFSFIQTGGTLNAGYGFALSGGQIDSYEKSFCRFDLASINSTFQMSGNAVLNVAKPTQNSGSPGGGLFHVGSSAANFNVTGGTINLYMGLETSTASYPGYITSTAGLYNVNIYEESATTQTAQLENDLIVLNNLTINTGSNSPVFVTNGFNLTVGGNFIIQSGTTFTPSSTGSITFNGLANQSWTNSGSISATIPAVVVDKTGILTVTNALGQNVTSLTLNNGTFADNGNTITVTGALSNSAIHTSTGSGSITYSASNTTIGGSGGTFGNLILTGASSTTTLSGNQTVTGNLQLNGATKCVLNIDIYNLTITSNSLTAISTSQNTGKFSANWCIQTNGLYGAGGLTRQGAAGDLVFPLGTGTTITYTPNTINVAATTQGMITVRPVNSQHPNVSTTNQSLQYFWRVTSTGFSGITAVTHESYTYATAMLKGTTGTYQPARFDPTTLIWATNGSATFNAGTINPSAIPNFNTSATGWLTILPSGANGPALGSPDKLDGEYTCGFNTAFGGVTAYYSMNNGNWNAAASANVWTSSSTHSGTAIAGPPCSTCPVVIGDGASINHTITINADSQNCGTVALNGGSTLDCSTHTGLNFGTNTSGTGILRIGSANFPQGDFTSFLGSSGGTVEWYGNNKTVPTTYTAPNGSSQNLNTYYNLILSPTGGQTITLPSTSLTIYNNLTQGSASAYTGNVNTNTTENLHPVITVMGDFTVSYGTFNFNWDNSSGTLNIVATTLSVNGDIVNNGTLLCASPNTTNTNRRNAHSITVSGNITNNGTMNLAQYYGTTNYNVANVTFTGTSSATFGGSGVTTLNLVTVNKGTSQADTVTCNLSGTLTTTPAAGGWLTLTNGTFDFEYTGTSSPITLSTTSYTIPSTAQLIVGKGTVQITNGTANDLFLNGTLQVSGGTVYMSKTDATGTGGFDIEYASAGTPTINVSAGSLTVDGSIRRSTSTLTGALIYNQTGGTVTVGGTGSSNTRGVFEIESNSGSSFTMTGTSVLNVQRQTGGTSYADLYINPVTSSVDPTSTINVGLSGTTQGNFRVNVVPTVGNFTVIGGTNAQTVNLYNDLAVGGTLTIASPSSLLTTQITPNADVTIGGDFICTGTYNTAGVNTTTFNGSTDQNAVLTSSTNFYNVTVNKSTGTILHISGTAPTAPGLNNLDIESGTLEVGKTGNALSASLKVNRNITIKGSATGTQDIEVYSTTGISNTITSSGGSFTNLTLGGTVSNATVAVSGNLTINGTFNLLNNANGAANRYFNIGSSQLTFGSTAPTPSNLGSTAFIRTNGVASDLGVVRNWTNTNSGTFVYAVGTSTNYTPVSYSLNVTGAGTLTVVPVNTVHNTAITSGTTDYILNYYWTVTRSSSLVATLSGNFTFKCPSSLRSGSTGTFVPGYLDPNALNSNGGWVTNVSGSSAANSSGTITLTFPSTPTTDFPSISPYYYDYSAGTTITLPNPIKGVYSKTGAGKPPVSAGGGDWTTGSNWTYLSNGDPTNSGTGDYSNAFYTYPHGLPVTISAGTQINLDTDGQVAYKTTINGTLYNAGTAGHNLGTISGTGTFRTATGTFPAGTYDAFVASTGGTIEYSATTTMNSLATYNNLVISNKTINNTSAASPSTVTMTASNITLNGALTISASGISGSPNVLDDSQNVSGQGNISVAKDFSNGGTFLEGASNVNITGNLATSTGATYTNTSGAITVLGNMTNGGTFSEGTGNVNVTGNLTTSTGSTYTNTSGAITLLGDLSNGGAFSEGTGNMTIAGNLTNTGTLTDGSGTISLSKNWSNTGTFNAGTGTVAFKGTAAQSVSGNNTFNNLTMNNTGAGLTLSSPTNVNGVLTMTSGNITSTSTNKLALSSTASSSGGSASSYVSGPMTKVLPSGSFTAPVGGVNTSVNLYRPVTIANPSASDTWSFQYFGNNPTNDSYPNLTMNTADILTVSQYEYWVIKPNSSTSGDLTLSYGSGSYNGSSIIGAGGDITHLRIGHWDGTQWDLPTTTSTYSQTQTGNTTAGTVTVTGVNDFSPFTFASIDATPMSALPVRLISFTGKAINDVVQLNWETATETNNNYFEVLHSTSGTDFESIGRVKGNGTTNVAHSYSLIDRDPALGKNYYQLKQVDFDGQTTSTEVILVNVLNVEPMISVYPNPITQGDLLNVKFNGLQASGSTELQIYNMQGIKVLNTIVSTDEQGALDTTITLSNLSTGLYILNVQDKYVKIIVE